MVQYVLVWLKGKSYFSLVLYYSLEALALPLHEPGSSSAAKPDLFRVCLDGKRKLLLLLLQKTLSVPSHRPPPQHQRWLEGEAYFPVSRVSQLTKNLGFPERIRRPVHGPSGGVEKREGSSPGSSSALQAWESAQLLHVQGAERKSVTVHETGYRSTEVLWKQVHVEATWAPHCSARCLWDLAAARKTFLRRKDV